MKRLIFLLIFLLSVILIAYAESYRPAPSPLSSVVTASAPQQEISDELDELDARIAELQTKLNVSYKILQKRVKYNEQNTPVP
ncbi:hypothetical protein L0337_25200 [candidate division KSB1 bacterium]|nr:hypothetical protein [candidate division KSB1 bacterium]